jgi:hypothetical protein
VAAKPTPGGSKAPAMAKLASSAAQLPHRQHRLAANQRLLSSYWGQNWGQLGQSREIAIDIAQVSSPLMPMSDFGSPRLGRPRQPRLTAATLLAAR